MKQTAAAALVALGLILAVINPDTESAMTQRQLSPPDTAKKAAPKETPKKKEGASIDFRIVEDEGC